MAQANDTIKDAGSPFSPTSDDQNPPDIILRSAGAVAVDFYTHKSVLSFAAPFFRSMFAFPAPSADDQNANPTRNGLSVVVMPESSAGLRQLLLACYGRVVGDGLKTLDGVDEALRSVHKYDVAGAKEYLQQVLLDFRDQEPYRVFSIACHHSLFSTACMAAEASLKHPLIAPMDDIPELDRIPTGQFRLLLRFRFEASQAICSELSDYVYKFSPQWYREPDQTITFWWRDGHAASCGSFEDWETGAEPPQWVSTHLETLNKAALERPEVDLIATKIATITAPMLGAIAKCPMCVEFAAEELQRMAITVPAQAKQRINAMIPDLGLKLASKP
ncbi:hypothetical protein C8F01DRAFT_1106169, partial [Mycena amicta]